MQKIYFAAIVISISVLGVYIVFEYCDDILHVYNIRSQSNLLQGIIYKPGLSQVPESDNCMRKESERSNRKDKLLRMLPQIEVPYVSCAELFAGNEKAIKSAENVINVRKLANNDYLELTKNCTTYRRRGYITMPINNEEEEFPIAYSIQIYKDIVQIERLLMAIYRPQNWYCINVDLSSDQSVHLAMISIANCFDNIIISNVDVKLADFSQIQADLMCMQLLHQKNKKWKYLLTLAGQMFPLKTNLDIVRILKALNGSNAVMATTTKRNLGRWNFLPPPPVNVTLVKGGCHFAVTRSFVNYVLTDERALLFKNWTSFTKFPDEHYFQSLSHSPQLSVPGAYTGWPENGENGYEQIIRYTFWIYNGGPCHGKYVRAVCIFGVGDLPLISKDYHLFVNKVYYDYQPMTMRCMEERHYNWTREDILGSGTDRHNMTFYRNLPNVRKHVPSGQEA